MTGRFGQGDIPGDNDLEHWAGEMGLNLLNYLIRQAISIVVHRQHDPFDLKSGVGRATHQRNGADQLAQPLQRIIFALDRDQDRVGRRQGIECQQAERRGTVNDQVVVVAQRRFDRFTQQIFAAGERGHLDFGADQIDRRRRHAQMGQFRRPDDRVNRLLPDQEIVGRRLQAAAIDSDTAGGVALRVDVEQQDVIFGRRERCGQIDRRGGFADAPLLVGDGDDFSHTLVSSVA